MGVSLGKKVTVTSNISSFMRGQAKYHFKVKKREETFVPVIISEPGDHPSPGLLFFSVKF